MEYEAKGWWNGPKHTPLLLWWICDPAVILHPYHVTLQMFAKIYYLLLDFLKACQSILIKKKLLVSFPTTLLDILDKNISRKHIPVYISWRWPMRSSILKDVHRQSWQSWIITAKSFIKTVLIKFCLSKWCPVPSSPEKVRKTNKNQTIASKKLKLKFRGKSYLWLPWSQMLPHTRVSVISQG